MRKRDESSAQRAQRVQALHQQAQTGTYQTPPGEAIAASIAHHVVERSMTDNACKATVSGRVLKTDD